MPPGLSKGKFSANAIQFTREIYLGGDQMGRKKIKAVVSLVVNSRNCWVLTLQLGFAMAKKYHIMCADYKHGWRICEDKFVKKKLLASKAFVKLDGFDLPC